MNRYWSLFFTGAAILAVVFYAAGPAMRWWFPGPALSPLGREIDSLFYMLLAVTGVTFIAVHAVMGYALWKFADRPGAKAHFIHGSHTLEVIWTVIPAGILLFMSLYQVDIWMRFRNYSTYDKTARSFPVAEVTARQFEWRIRYPAPGKKLQPKPQPDDLYTVNELHVPFGKPMVIHLRSEDVLHSFFLPHLRVKQDAVPGQVIPVQFEGDKEGKFEIVCAELCGWGHYKMRGELTVEQRSKFDKFLVDLARKQNDDGVSGGTGPASPAAGSITTAESSAMEEN